jgi:hypothetical protein
MNSPRMGGGSIPGSPVVKTLTGTDPFLQVPHMRNPDRASVASDILEDYFAQRRGSTINGSLGTPVCLNKIMDIFSTAPIGRSLVTKNTFWTPSWNLAWLLPIIPPGAHYRVSSVESISSIIDEKQNSPLDKAIASVSFLL